MPAVEVLDAGLTDTRGRRLERLRIRAARPVTAARSTTVCFLRKPAWKTRAIDFEKGCYPGQEPIARQHYRGRVNRSFRVLALDGEALPEYDAELVYEGKAVGRVTSAALDGRRRRAGVVRREVPADATLDSRAAPQRS